MKLTYFHLPFARIVARIKIIGHLLFWGFAIYYLAIARKKVELSTPYPFTKVEANNKKLRLLEATSLSFFNIYLKSNTAEEKEVKIGYMPP